MQSPRPSLPAAESLHVVAATNHTTTPQAHARMQLMPAGVYAARPHGTPVCDQLYDPGDRMHWQQQTRQFSPHVQNCRGVTSYMTQQRPVPGWASRCVYPQSAELHRPMMPGGMMMRHQLPTYQNVVDEQGVMSQNTWQQQQQMMMMSHRNVGGVSSSGCVLSVSPAVSSSSR